MSGKATLSDGLTANRWENSDRATTPGWAADLLEIQGVRSVTALSDREAVAVDTRVHPDEDGIAKPAPEMMTELDGHADWGIQQVKLRAAGEHTVFRVELVPRTPTCDAEDCFMPATGEIENVLLDGKSFTVTVCERCAAEMDRREDR
jgi:hypothetical protein